MKYHKHINIDFRKIHEDLKFKASTNPPYTMSGFLFKNWINPPKYYSALSRNNASVSFLMDLHDKGVVLPDEILCILYPNKQSNIIQS